MSALLRTGLQSLLLFATAVTFGQAQPPIASAVPDSNSEAPSAPLLIELFTSQGCYSCPPADKLLRELGKYEQLIPLSFHVDYWNHLGWTDPFSNEDWSARQRRYARLLRSDTVYTPQLVIDGTVDEVGSDRMEVLAKIEDRLGAPPSAQARSITLKARLVANSDGTSTVAAVAVAEPALVKGTELLIALYERHLETEIPSGENRNKTLHYDYVVRRLQSAQSAVAETLVVEPGWKQDDLGVVAFVQDTRSGVILGIARAKGPLEHPRPETNPR